MQLEHVRSRGDGHGIAPSAAASRVSEQSVTSTDRPDPLSIMWLRVALDRRFHAVVVDQMSRELEPPGPVALCGQRVVVTSLFDDPAGPACDRCVTRLGGR
jgi:hypothetical protein